MRGEEGEAAKIIKGSDEGVKGGEESIKENRVRRKKTEGVEIVRERMRLKMRNARQVLKYYRGDERKGGRRGKEKIVETVTVKIKKRRRVK